MKYVARSIAFTVIVVVAGACSQSQPQTNQSTASPTPTPTPRRLSKDREEDRTLPIENARIVDVLPTADGGAYALSNFGQIWYVKGNQAIRVQEVESLTARLSPLNAKAFNFALLTKERRRGRELLAAFRDLQGELDEAQSELSELKESRDSQ